MNGNMKGLLLLAIVLMIVSGTVLALGVDGYAKGNEEVKEQSYWNGMQEMHNYMMGTEISLVDLVSLHESGDCFA